MPLSANEDREYQWARLFSVDFSDVRHSLRVLRRYRRQDVRGCILREIIVAYVRPFSGNKDSKGKYQINAKSYVPRAHRALHKYLVNLRQQFIAHTDFAPNRQPRIVSFAPPSNGRIATMAFWAFDYARVDAKIAEIEQLVAAVDANLDQRIRELELQR